MNEQKPISTRLSRFRMALRYANSNKLEKINALIAKEHREIAEFCRKEEEENEDG